MSAVEQSRILFFVLSPHTPWYTPVGSQLSVSFLIDSGADESFIDLDMVKQANIPAEALSEPKIILV